MVKDDIKKLKLQLQLEVDSSFLYQKLSEHYQPDRIAKIFQKMSEIEAMHARKVLRKIQNIKPHFSMPAPSFRAKCRVKLAEYFGYGFILTNLASTEWQIARNEVEKKRLKGEKITGFENLHLNILQNLSQDENLQVKGNLLTKFEGKHRLGGNELRAAVLGANDGLVSNMNLVMGVAGAATNQATVLIAGIAGLLAGSISMALGEWLSVQSSRELYEQQIEIEAEELENSPEEEMNELILLYQAKGMEEKEAIKLAQEMMSDKEKALDTLVREELGIDREVLGGSAWAAAIVSFLLFSIGAVIPVLPFFFFIGTKAIIACLVASTVGLFTVGSSITILTGKNFFYSGFRQVVFGLVAAGITFMIGRLLGISISG